MLYEKQIVGGNSGVNHLLPVKYHWAYEGFKAACKNFWLPGEIAMGEDKLQWETGRLTPDEQHLFKSVFATLTTSDILIQRNLAVAVMERITAPEVEVAIAAQINQEAIHSDTYAHVLENLGLNPEEIYTLYERVPEIKQKFALAKEFTDGMSPDSRLKDYVKGLIFYYGAFEGVWFFNGFSPLFSLQRRNLMARSCEQLQYIARDESKHADFGIRLIREIIKETGVHIPQDAVEHIFKAALAAESEYARYAIPAVLGYNADTHIEHTKYLLDKRAVQLGFNPIWNAKPGITWLDEQIGGVLKEKNFFESRVTEYQVGALEDFETSRIEEVVDWK